MASLGILIPVAFVAFLLAGLAQSLTGFGSSLVAAPILALAVGAHTTVVAVTLVSVALTGWASMREREHVDRRLTLQVSVAGLVGLPLGLVLLRLASNATLSLVMAVTVVVALILVAVPIKLPKGLIPLAGAGVTSGALLTSTGMNGPPLVLAFVAQDMEPRPFRATLQRVLCFQDVAAIVGFVIVGTLSRDAFIAAALGIVSSPLGWLLGDRLFDKISATMFRRVLIVGLAVSALLLVLT